MSSHTVQNVLDLMDRYLSDWGEYVPLFTADSTDIDGTNDTFRTKKFIDYESERVYVNSVLKTRSTHYDIVNNRMDIKFTAGNIPTEGQSVTANFIEKRFPFEAKLNGIKSVLSDYYYVAKDDSLDLTGETYQIDISSLNPAPKEVLRVEINLSTDASYERWVEFKGWHTDTEFSPTTITTKSAWGNTLDVRITYTVAYSTSLTTPSSTIDTKFPDETGCLEVLALGAGSMLMTGARARRVMDDNFPASANDNVAKAYDYMMANRDLKTEFEAAERRYIHLLRPPVRRGARF